MPTKNARAADIRTRSIALPLRFILTGVAALLAGSVWLVLRPDMLATYHYNQYVIAATHLFVLGWICSVIMGAMYQLAPVAFETRLHSDRLAECHLALHVVGFIGMVAMFQVWNMKQVGYFGAVLAIGVAASLFWLSLTILAGIYLAVDKSWSFSPFNSIAQIHAHAHLGGLGFLVMMIVAVSYKLVPMFALSEVQSARRAGWSLALLNAGLAGVFVSILISSSWKFMFALVILGGLAIYGLEMAAILRARKRRSLDWGLKYFLTAIALLVPVSALGTTLAWPHLPLTMLTGQLENVYGFLAFIGVVTFAILGMLYKVVPFLVWYASYSKAIGRAKVPSLADLYSPALQAAGYWLFIVGLLLTSIATTFGHEACVRVGCVLLLASVGVFVVNIGKVIAHLFRPRIEPFILNSASQGIP